MFTMRFCRNPRDSESIRRRYFQNAVELPGHKQLSFLSPEDMLHSAAHLFHEGGLENGLRDLFDLDNVELFSATPGFTGRGLCREPPNWG